MGFFFSIMIFLNEYHPNFPNPREVDPPGGLIAVGGDLSRERIEKAYQATIPTLWMQLDEKSDYGLREMLEKAQDGISP